MVTDLEKRAESFSKEWKAPLESPKPPSAHLDFIIERHSALTKIESFHADKTLIVRLNYFRKNPVRGRMKEVFSQVSDNLEYGYFPEFFDYISGKPERLKLIMDNPNVFGRTIRVKRYSEEIGIELYKQSQCEFWETLFLKPGVKPILSCAYKTTDLYQITGRPEENADNFQDVLLLNCPDGLGEIKERNNLSFQTENLLLKAALCSGTVDYRFPSSTDAGDIFPLIQKCFRNICLIRPSF